MQPKQKIIVIGPGYPYRNGQSIYLAHLCKKLSSEFTIELLNYSMLYPNFLFPGSTQFDEGKDEQIIFENKRILNSLNPVSWWKTAQYIKKAKPDIIAIDWWHPFFGPCIFGLTSFLPKRLKKRILLITENVISHEAGKVDKIFTKLGFKNGSCFLALSNAVEEQLSLMVNKKIFRSALPIYDFYKNNEKSVLISKEELHQKLNIAANNKILLFFGLVRRYKGLDILLIAFAAIVKERQDVKLIIAGEFYEDVEMYMNLIRTHNLSEYVKVENTYIPDEEVSQYFNLCDAVIMPYRSATQSGIMSIAYGFYKPVVVTDVGELSSWVEDGKTGFVVPPEDPEHLKIGILKLLSKIEAGVDFHEPIREVLKRKDVFGEVNKVFKDILEFMDN